VSMGTAASKEDEPFPPEVALEEVTPDQYEAAEADGDVPVERSLSAQVQTEQRKLDREITRLRGERAKAEEAESRAKSRGDEQSAKLLRTSIEGAKAQEVKLQHVKAELLVQGLRASSKNGDAQGAAASQGTQQPDGPAESKERPFWQEAVGAFDCGCAGQRKVQAAQHPTTASFFAM